MLTDVFATYMSGWNDYSVELKELIDAGDQVIAVLHETAKMRDTDVPLDRDLVHLWTVRDGRTSFLRVFQTKEEALEAAGLREATSEENVEIIRAVYDAYNRGDFDAAVPTTAHPDLEVVPSGDQPPIKGAAQVRAWMKPDAFESQVIEPLDLRAAGSKVLVRARTRIRGAGSGIEAEFLFWAVWTFNEAGLTTRVEIYLDHQEAEALEAAGLRG